MDEDATLEQSTSRRTRRRRRILRGAAASGLALSLSLGGYAVASAATSTKYGKSAAAPLLAPPGAPGGGVMGTVSAVGSASLTITHENGTSETFTTNSSTVYVKDGASASSSDLAVGDNVDVLPTSSGSTTASEIDIFSPSITGTVVADSGSALTVEDGEGFWRTVDVSASTSYELGGESATASVVSVGERVMALGSIDADHTTLDATEVDVVLPSIAGTVQSVSGDTITLTTRSGTATVTTTSSTVYKTSSGTGTASDVTKGTMIVAEGQESSETALTATSISVLPTPPSGSSKHRGAAPGGPTGGGPGGAPFPGGSGGPFGAPAA